MRFKTNNISYSLLEISYEINSYALEQERQLGEIKPPGFNQNTDRKVDLE
jgi:hypothetical protein